MQYLFLAIPLSLIFLSHFGVYHFFVTVFGIEQLRMRRVIGIIFFFLSFSFIGSMILVHFWESFLTRIFYAFSGLWIGFLVNFLLFYALFGIFLLVFKISGLNFNLFFIGQVLFAFAVLYSCFGIFNVFYPRVKNIDIEINNLPEEWKGKKIVQLSDVHLGKVLGVNFLNNVVSRVESINPDMVVITGDLFDGVDGDLDVFTEGLNKLKADRGVFFVNGNHEIYLGKEEAVKVLEKTNIRILDDEVVDVDGLQIIGVSFPGFGETKDGKKIIEDNEVFSSEKPNILLYHSPTSIFADKNNNNHSDIYFSPDVNFDNAKELGIDLQLSGHTHKGQIFPFGFITRLIYGKYDYGLHEEGDFSIYTSSGTGVWGPMMRTGSRSEIVVLNLENKK